jgi:Gluconate 2-dehydrogenase subunit 3
MRVTDPPRYPGYDVLAKRNTPSWDAITRRVIDERLATPETPRFFSGEEWAVADALCRRIMPQPDEADTVSLVAFLDAKLLGDYGGGFREASMPYMREAWRKALFALDDEARAQHDRRGFAELTNQEQDALLSATRPAKSPVNAGPELMRRHSSNDAYSSTCPRFIMPTRRPGTRSDLVGRRLRAVTSVSTETGSIPGKRSRLRPGKR